jgi:inhibitor of KinA sporulation pathway (predicted exonuclease)
MNLIVVDLEWNSASRSQKIDPGLVSLMRFEIIEVGAVRLSEDLSLGKTFHRYVTPVLYKKIHYHIANVTKRTQKSLREGVLFTQMVDELVPFAGEKPIFASWGTSDPEVFLSNCHFHGIGDSLQFRALNAQAVFSGLAEGVTSANQRSVEYALDFLRFEKDLPFHEAITDAIYTARILSRTLEMELADRPEETIESLLMPYVYDPRMTRQSENVITLEKGDDVIAYLELYDFTCPACGSKIDLAENNSGGYWYTVKAGKRWFAAATCDKHGDIEISVRKARRTDVQSYMIRTLIPERPIKIPFTGEEDTPFMWIDPDA